MIRRVAAVVLGLVLLALGGGWFYLRSSLPEVDGTVAVRGLGGTVTIARDADGVPLITAADDADAVFGLGFAHAQDRLFQMELQRRYAEGRLAEVFGPDALPIDRQMRILGIYRAAYAEWPELPEPVRRGLTAYAAGVNAFLDMRRGALPPEMLLLRLAPRHWKPADTLVWGKLMDLQLGGNYRGELERARLARSVSAADMAVLYPDYPPDGPSILAGLAPIYRQLPLDALYHALADSIGPTLASNNWVVAGAHSASGKPLVANDPHLGFAAPGFWYLARLRTPEREIAGATVAGTPFVVIGHNDHVAWGFTTATADIEDLFIEKLDPADGARYLTPDGSAPFLTRRETIGVRGGEPVELTVRETRHGPVLSDSLPAGSADPGYVLALQTTFLTSDDRSAAALWALDRADNTAQFRQALADLAGPPQNVVYADDAGAIGYIMPGRVPVRKSGNGWMPVPGWSGDYDWQGYIPFDALPQATNPPAGRFLSANNKIVPDSYRYFISRDWDIPDRAERIGQLLDAVPIQSAAASAAIEADTLSIMAQRLVPLMTAFRPYSDDARTAVERLRQWDFRMDRDKPEPLIFTAWLREFALEVFINRLGSDLGREYWNLRPRVIEAVLTQHRDWCAAPCEDVLSAALENVLSELHREYGSDMAGWQYGRAHIAEFQNRVVDRIPLLRDWLRVAIATPGASDTVNVGPSSIHDPVHPFRQLFGAGLRIITDMANPRESRIIAVPGQSGNPLSPHYDDLLTRWRDFGWLVPGKARPVATLILEPAR